MSVSRKGYAEVYDSLYQTKDYEKQPVFHDMGLFINESYPVAEKITRQGLHLPSGLTLTEEQIENL